MAERITKEDIRNIPIGESRTWTLENPQKCLSARVTASSLNSFEGMNLSTSIDAKTSTITITNNGKTIEA